MRFAARLLLDWRGGFVGSGIREHQARSLIGVLPVIFALLSVPSIISPAIAGTPDSQTFGYGELITQQRTVYLASPLEGNLIQAAGQYAGQPTIFARELEMLDAAGYVRVGDYLVPPG